MNKLVELSPIQAQMDWPQAEKYLEQSVASERAEKELRQMKARVFAGMNTLWKIEDADGKATAWATTFIYTSDGETKTAQINVATAHDLEMLVEKLDEFEVWAMKHDITYIEILGRLGWMRVMKNFGFEHNYTSLVKRMKELH